MKKTLSIVLLVLLVFLAVACSPEHKHDYQLVESKSVKATCESGGYDYMECSCGAIQSIPTAALGHAYVEDKEQYKAPTCVAKGRKVEYCSRCEEPKETTLPMNANNHPFFNGTDGGSDGKTSYEGLYNDLATATVSVWPTCSSDGKATFTHCSACGKDIQFETVVPKEIYFKDGNQEALTKNIHVKLAENASEYTSYNDGDKAVLAITAEDIKKYVGKTPATAFSDGTEANICPTCGKEMTNNELTYHVIPSDLNLIVGDWTYTYTKPSDNTTSYRLWVDFEKTNGYYSATAYTKSENEGVVDKDGTGLYSIEDLGFADLTGTGIGVLTFDGDKTLTTYFDLENGYVLKTDATKNSNKALIVLAAKKDVELKNGKKLLSVGDLAAVALKGNGEFDIPTTLSGAWTNVAMDKIGTDNQEIVKLSKTDHVHEWKLMSDRRAVTPTGHYLSCSCGLSYVNTNHGDDCEYCGYKKTEWFEVEIYCSGAVDSFALPYGSFVTIPDGGTSGASYINFFGSKTPYKGKATPSGQADSSTTTVFYGKEGEKMTLTISN